MSVISKCHASSNDNDAVPLDMKYELYYNKVFTLFFYKLFFLIKKLLIPADKFKSKKLKFLRWLNAQ